jgi:hypothetical protein
VIAEVHQKIPDLPLVHGPSGFAVIPGMWT